jgi:hypothetical protein
MDRLLNVITGLSALLLLIVLVSVRRAHIRVEYSVSWLLAAGAMLLLSLDRAALAAAAVSLGIPGSPMALFLIAGAVFLIVLYRYSVIISGLRDDNVALAQRVAILEYHLQNLRQHDAGAEPTGQDNAG